jgi:hypothetical protein
MGWIRLERSPTGLIIGMACGLLRDGVRRAVAP